MKTNVKKSSKKVETKKMPNGKVKTLSIRDAIKLSKKGVGIYRASNGSYFGETYLNKVVDKDRKMQLIVAA